jgi:hypothetical protein
MFVAYALGDIILTSAVDSTEYPFQFLWCLACRMTSAVAITQRTLFVKIAFRRNRSSAGTQIGIGKQKGCKQDCTAN